MKEEFRERIVTLLDEIVRLDDDECARLWSESHSSCQKRNSNKKVKMDEQNFGPISFRIKKLNSVYM